MLNRDSLNNALSKLSLHPNIDLFTSQLNNQFPQYVSFKPDPSTVAVDAFSLNLRYLKFYAFSPIQCNQRISSASAGGPSMGNSYHAQLADTSLVSPSHADVRGATDYPSSSQAPPKTTRETQATTSTSQEPDAASMPLVREQLQKLGLSPDTMTSSWLLGENPLGNSTQPISLDG